ncbi:MAG: ATP-binding protein [Chthoniobacteraceae bacterium]
MNLIRNLPIRSKVVLVTMLTACAALLLAGAALLWLELSEFRANLERDVATLAKVIGANSVAAISFDDRSAATEMLTALRAEPKILAACIYGPNGQRLGTFRRPGSEGRFPAAPAPDGFALAGDRLTYFAPIDDEREHVRIGTIYFEANFGEMRDRLYSYARLLGVVLLASGLVALGLSAALQHYITGPIVSLADATKRVSTDRDYSLRVPRDGDDELGGLIDGFNEMLEQIQTRDAALRAAQATLEKRVVDRTAELQQEVAERRRAEEDLARSLSLVNATLDSTADGILVVDRAGKVVDFNRKFVTMWRLPEDLVATRDNPRLIECAAEQVKDRETFIHKTVQLLADTVSESHDVIDFADGRLFERYSKPQQIDGACVGRVWSFRDVTQRARAEERIREQASLLDLAQDAIVVRDMSDVTVFWNKGAERVLGWTNGDVVGRELGTLFQKDAARFLEAKRLVVERGAWSGELTHLNKSGREVRTESRWTLLRDDAGQAKSVLTISTDVTEQKKLEAQFLRAQRMESIGTLAGGIAHDLNNMLAPILVSIDLLRAQNTDPGLEPIYESVTTSAERGADLVRQILQFARGAEGKRTPMGIERVVREVCKIARDTFPKNIEFRYVVADDLCSVSGDATQLHQVLLNLCVNARDAMPDGGTLVIEAENFFCDGTAKTLKIAPAVGPHVLIRVSDTGTGIPAELREKIFEPFFTTKEVGKGTGLGLSTAAAIVKGHEGLLDVTSEPGLGTTFTLCLPALSSPAEVARPEIAMMPLGNKELVLLIDDEESIRLVIGQTLEGFGYRVITAADGRSAVATFAERQRDIAIVVTDMMMPGIDGVATIRALKAIDPNVRVIAATGLMTEERVLKASEAGASAFLRKPFSAEAMLRTIRQVLTGGVARKAA